MVPWKEPGREERWEAAMERLESAAWPLAGGVLCAFVIAIALKDASWPAGLAVVTGSVVGWSLVSASPAVGAVIGVAAWAFVTGFDVDRTGDLVVTRPGDVGRILVLAGAGAAAGVAGARMRRVPPSRAETGWPAPPEEWSGDGLDAYRSMASTDDETDRPGTARHAIPLQRNRPNSRRGGRPRRPEFREGKQS
ncbi:hypothetical protein ACQPZP_41520 [Spirillospora sp. CA-142024]|uniref:hypothetical protein n=1 Tax=Spirillospora sp. CA-142024 TaxID=3240036 RepID=UPI003D9194AD